MSFQYNMGLCFISNGIGATRYLRKKPVSSPRTQLYQQWSAVLGEEGWRATVSVGGRTIPKEGRIPQFLL